VVWQYGQQRDKTISSEVCWNHLLRKSETNPGSYVESAVECLPRPRQWDGQANLQWRHWRRPIPPILAPFLAAVNSPNEIAARGRRNASAGLRFSTPLPRAARQLAPTSATEPAPEKE
jgi:hypothetical protein